MKTTKIENERMKGKCLNCSDLFNYYHYKKGGITIPKNTQDDGGWDDDHSTIGVE